MRYIRATNQSHVGPTESLKIHIFLQCSGIFEGLLIFMVSRKLVTIYSSSFLQKCKEGRGGYCFYPPPTFFAKILEKTKFVAWKLSYQ